MVAGDDGGKRFTATFKIDVILRMRRKLRGFGATVCKTVRPMLSDRCLSVMYVCHIHLPVTLVYCGKTVGWIKMKLGMLVGLGRDHTVLDGDPAPSPQKRGRSPQFWPLSIVTKRLPGSR